MNIETVYAEFNQRLSPFGKVVIAGGAVRDSLMGKQPKDYDIFVLRPDGFDFEKDRKTLTEQLHDLTKVVPVVQWHGSEPFLAATVQWRDREIQVLVNPQPSKEALIATFDWNVCLFAYDGAMLCGENIDNIGPGKTLRLNKVTFPASTLRRGFRFSERFLMVLEHETVADLCRQIIAKADAKNNVGPSGNEPDMPSLTANSLVDNRVESIA